MSNPSRRRLLTSTAVGAFSVAAAPWLDYLARAAGPERPARPNFIFILIDDMGWADVGCDNPGTFYETPNIDRLAKESMRFTSGYAACPVCSPTRSSILTGRYPARTHLTNFLKGEKWPADSPLEKITWADGMALDEVTIAEALKEAGYATGFVGKWHLGKDFPEKQGFDVNIDGGTAGSPKTYIEKDGQYLTDRHTDEALKFITDSKQKEKPFFLCLWHYAVHIPLGAKPDLLAKYQAKAKAKPPDKEILANDGPVQYRQVQNLPVYAAMVESVDQSVGRIMVHLEKLGISDRTVIIFTSDNGGLSTAEGRPTSNLPLRAGKGWLYEGGVREPMIVKWPGVTKEGSICDVPITSPDFYPTMLEMAGLPLKPEQHRDGESLLPLLKETGSLKRDAVYWHYPHYSNQFGTPGGAVRQGNWKLIEFYEDGRLELYNLKDDPGERKNLAAQSPEKARELRQKLDDWRRAVGATMPARKPRSPDPLQR